MSRIIDSLCRAQGRFTPKPISLDDKISEVTAISSCSEEEFEPIGCLNVSSSVPPAEKKKSMTFFRRNKRSLTTSSVSSSTGSKKGANRVRFATGDGFEPPLAVIVSSSPRALSDQEMASTFYSRKEIAKEASRYQIISEKIATDRESQVNQCLEFLNGFVPEFYLKGREMTPATALQYYFSRSLPNDTVDKKESTLRGLERTISSKIVDRRLSYVQFVLRLQREIRSDESPGIKGRKRTCPPEERLAKEARRASAGSRQCAYRLAKADRAVVEKLCSRDTVSIDKQ